ncbi:MAG: caspase family protein, partial [Planctomycetes bacterium]|nr:caspase family protein [Planctomycetota bacterium]
RTATCDALLYSEDGKFLFAAGDDKIVRYWPSAAVGLDAKNMQSLRWPSWREQRGGIKALAISPDAERVVVGGFGLRSSTVALINRKTGEIEEITYPESAQPGENFYAVMSAAFSPDGKSVAFGTADGSVWLWKKGEKPKRVGKQVGRKADGKAGEFNRIRLVAFLKSGRILSVSQTGQIQAWELDKFEQTASDKGKMFIGETSDSPVFRAVLANDREWLAVGGNDPVIVLYNLRTEEKKVHILNEREYVRALAFDRDTKKLAATIGTLVKGAQFSMDADDRIVLFDNPTAAKELKAAAGPKHSHRAEALAFDDQGRLAVAGGENHEVTLWDLANVEKPVSVIRGTGRNIWGVRVSTSGASIAYQPARDSKTTDPNKRGTGNYLAFDLTRGKPLKAEADWVEPLSTADGWSIEPSSTNRFIWYAVHAAKSLKHALPLNPDRDEAPRCYTFLNATADQPTRVIVGHYYGWSMYNLTDAGATRHFIGVGHSGEVMSIAPSKDQKWFITSGTDQTVAGWSAVDWKYHPRFGAGVEIENGKLTVKKLDVGSPAWEMGLIEGDEIVLLVVGTDAPVFNRSGKHDGRYGPPKGTAEDALAKLKDPTPGTFLHIGWKRGGKENLREQVTSLPRRPLWRFFPSFDEKNALTDWIVWMWKTSAYHTSTNGDYLVGWHVNHPTLDGTPKFYRAEQFRENFNKPHIVLPLLTNQDLGAAIDRWYGPKKLAINFGAMEPAPIVIEPREPVLGPNGFELTLKVSQRGTNPDLLPERVELWVNDFRFETWSPNAQKFEQKITIPANKLRDGQNQITLQTFNKLGGRGEAFVMADAKVKPQEAQMLGLFVGINTYENSKVKNPDGGRAFGDLKSAVNDAITLHESWQKHKGPNKLFPKGNSLEILDVKAKRQEVLNSLDALAKTAQPNDLLIVFLSGHGDYVRPTVAKGEAPKPGIFVFCCPDYDRKNHSQTGIETELLIDKLAQIPCRKLVLLDACHSGEAASANQVRGMAPNGKGLTIIAACDQQEQAFEHEKFKNGLFTYAVMEALGSEMGKADTSKDGQLDAEELFRYVRNRLPELLKQAGKDEYDQNPICFPRQPEKYPIGKK